MLFGVKTLISVLIEHSLATVVLLEGEGKNSDHADGGPGYRALVTVLRKKEKIDKNSERGPPSA